jgi:hypothetical protein
MDEVSYIGHKVVPLLDFSDLLPEEQLEALDRYGEEAQWDGEFFCYRGSLYSTWDFMISEAFPVWDGKADDTFFSSILVKFDRENDRANVVMCCV